MATFTALNGGSPKTAEAVNGSAEMKRTGSDERVNGQVSAPEPKPSGEVSTSSRENWTGSTLERPSYQPANYPDVDGSHKRKRSDSIEARREHAPTQDRSPDSATQPKQHESRDPYGTPKREYRPTDSESREHNDSWYSHQSREDRGIYEQQHSASSAQGQTEEQIGDALRRAANQADNHSDYGNTSPDGEDRGVGVYGGSYTPDQRRDPVLQSDPKKRKRNFSNRTKTGCLTCRKRKKKCDEQKPECKFWSLYSITIRPSASSQSRF
jgi:hypothetical protein